MPSSACTSLLWRKQCYRRQRPKRAESGAAGRVAAPVFSKFVRQQSAPTRIVTSGMLLTGSDDALEPVPALIPGAIFQVMDPT